MELTKIVELLIVFQGTNEGKELLQLIQENKKESLPEEQTSY